MPITPPSNPAVSAEATTTSTGQILIEMGSVETMQATPTNRPKVNNADQTPARTRPVAPPTVPAVNPPTTLALRTQRYKFIQYHGIWDIDELYDLQEDPHEQHNLIFAPKEQQRIRQMRTDLHNILVDANANRVPFSQKRSMGANLRLRSGSTPAAFPPELMRNKNRDE